jgi:hypothetical protein
MASTNKFKSKWKIKAVLDNIDDLKELNLKEKSAGEFGKDIEKL